MGNRFEKVAVISLLWVGSMLFFGVNGKAYIDPSVTSYIIQAVAGIVIAVGAFVGIYFRKIKKKATEKLGIDENRNKEVETDEVMKKNEQAE